MPGLSQLKQFSSDILSLGDEINLRAARGEKPVKIEIPKDIEDINDSEEFVLGMPVIEAEPEISSADEDLSDLTALVNPSATKSDKSGEAEPAPSFEAPDMSALLNPVVADNADDAGMPDLSMFDEPEEAEEEVVEEEPEEISIADMGLDALLAGGGFDEPEPVPEPEPAPAETAPAPEVPDFDMSVLDSVEPLDEAEPLEDAEPLEEVAPLDDAETLEDMPSLDEMDPLSEAEPLTEAAPGDALSLDELMGAGDSTGAGDAMSFDDAAPADEVAVAENASSFDEPVSLDDIPSFDEPSATEETPSFDEAAPLEESPSFDMSESFDAASPLEEAPSSDSFDMPDSFDIPEVPESFDETAETPENSETSETPDASMDFPSFDSFDEAAPEESASEGGSTELEELGDLDFEIPEEAPAETAGEIEAAESSEKDSGIPDGLFDAGDFDLGGAAEGGDTPDFSAEDEIPDYDTSGLDDEGGEEAAEGDENALLEVFDTSEMEGMDFGIQDTDSQLGGGGEGDFELGSHDDFAMEGEFEIPGFSDVATAKEEKSSKPKLATGKDKTKKPKGKGKNKDLDEPDFSEAAESEDLPPNTLSDAQYKVFLKNLSEYPLNVRLAFEDFIVQDEFTDDAEFEIIEKILNKAPARTVAGMLEKMLDTSIPIPRDFEHRTAAEYEAYKKSLSYQLRNKIIPGVLLGLLLTIVGWGLVKFTNYCIYRPLKANSLYKQGYALLQADEYPQAEMRFEEAVKKRINKKWFFKYARGYREHKQYQRAGNMYQNILRYFRHDKMAGLEYADMELNDLANYERAEEIVRREVLDYHINDADGILKLGDVFLEWGTEKDPSKLELAREQYATLIQLYKPTDLYMSRMMRYFIRTDNLREVIQMQKTFENREKSLGSDDWTELSGYLLDKYYGALAPSEEYLRFEIEGLRGLLLRAVKTNPDNPIAQYNLAKYFLKTNETSAIESTLQRAIEKFNTVPSMKKRDLYKYIDSYRLLGEHYIGTTDYLQAQEQFAEGISLFTTERDNAGFEGTPAIGKLYEDMGDIKYTISGDYDDALFNYKYSVELENDSPSIRYRIGYIQYKKKNYSEALGAFMKAGDGNVKERNLMLAMANTLYLRGDDYAAQGYYNQLIDELDDNIAENGLVLPQANVKDYDLINTYLYASNNYGVTLYKLAKRTGNSALNAQAMVQLSQSVRAWDALTRNQQSMVRLEGSNLAEQNIKYITHPIPEFEPSVYTDISKTLLDNERL